MKSEKYPVRLYSILLFLLVAVGMLSSCGSGKRISRKGELIPGKYFSGVLLYDPESRDTLVSLNASHYFTPASTLKLFTLYVANEVLPDSAPTLYYAETQRNLYIKPAANPAFLHDSLPDATFAFLEKSKKDIIVVADTLSDFKYGYGWQWDDFEFYYMPEKSLFPLYGNLVRLYPDGHIVPSYFQSQVRESHPLGFARDFDANVFYLNGHDQVQKIPFITSPGLSAQLLSDTLHRPVFSGSLPENVVLRPYVSTPLIPVYKRLMDESENFIAEQLMLMVAREKTGVYRVGDAIRYALDSLLSELPDPPRWVDGSGLSRYNMFTPADMVYLLDKMYREWGREKVFSLLPFNGKEGKLYHWYPSETKFVYAKTGSLSNHHNLCGYLVAKSGKVLIFSIMNNNFTLPSKQVKERINRILKRWYEKY